MFRALICPSSGVCVYVVELPHWLISFLACCVLELGCGSARVVSGLTAAGDSHNFPHPGHIACCSTPNSRPPATKALQTICGNNTSIVSSSWWWAYKCPKHVEKITIVIKHSVASSWFPSLHAYNTMHGQTYIKLIVVTQWISSDLKYHHDHNVNTGFIPLFNETHLFK